VLLGYVVANTDEEVARHLNWKYRYGEWLGDPYSEDPSEQESLLPEYVEHKGDFHTELSEDYHTQKLGWEDKGKVDDDQIDVLRAVGVIDELITPRLLVRPNAPE
jgi:hypothetical protein